MTEAAFEVFEAAAAPKYPVNLPPWEISKLYLPAWSGAGGSYDDEVPPPSATLTVDMTGADLVSGWTWERIGQMSRSYHRTQGMGRWVPAGAERDRPLHLAATRLDGRDDALSDGLPGLDDLGAGIDPVLCATIEAFPDGHLVLTKATEALQKCRHALNAAEPKIGIRLERKVEQLSRVIRLAAEVEVFGHLNNDWLHPGEKTALTIETRNGRADTVEVIPELPEGWACEDGHVGPGPAAPPSDPYPPTFCPLAPAAPARVVRVTALGEESETRIPLLVPPVVLPGRSAKLSDDRAVINIATKNRSIEVLISGVTPAGSDTDLRLPDGWKAKQTGQTWRITAPESLTAGLYRIPVLVDGEPVQSIRRISHAHIAPRARATAAELTVLVLNAALPKTRVGYIGGGNDRVDHWLAAIGADIHTLGDDELSDPSALADYDTLVIGIFAIRHRPTLQSAMPVIHDWVEAGGTLVTLYHRPWDNWDPDTVPPRCLEIGQPSLRWRVTNEAANVDHIAPEHPLLTTPNQIGPDDWQGWNKDRGLYFAKSWDKAYVPLLEMADPGEAPHRGALLCAEIGRGRHVHCALILHHQMEKLVPGAFRLFANLIAPHDG